MSYAVVWSENGGCLHAGRLELADGAVLLEGTAEQACRALRQLLYEELACVRVERRPEARLGGRPTLVLEDATGSRMRIVSVEGGGSLHELADLVERARGAAAVRAGQAR